jgi:DNA-binding MarR family transcriptional regulator
MPLDPDRYKGLAGFRLALRRFLAASEAICREAGVTAQQYQALLAIKTKSNETMPMKELAEQLMITPHAAVQLVDRLAKAGLAERGASAADRRAVVLALTGQGAQLLDELASRHLDEMLRQEPLLTRSLRQLRRMAPKNYPRG